MSLYPGTTYEHSATASRLGFTAGACPLDEEGRVFAPGDFAYRRLGSRLSRPARRDRGDCDN